MKKTISVIAISICLAVNTFGQTKLTENTLQNEKGAKGAAAKVSDMEWMAGSWAGEAFGGKVREVWTTTGGGVMMGMFVLAKDEKPAFYEFLTFQVVDDQLFLKLKHFNPDMTGWEEKDDTVNFRFIKKEGNRYYFHGLTFENAGENSLNIFLALRQKDGSRNEVVFAMNREQ